MVTVGVFQQVMLELHPKDEFRIGRKLTGTHVGQLLLHYLLIRPRSVGCGLHLHFQTFRHRTWFNFKGQRHDMVQRNFFRCVQRGVQLHTGNGDIRCITGIGSHTVAHRNCDGIAHIITDICVFPVKEFQVRILLNLVIADSPTAFTAPVLAGHVGQQTPVRRLVHQDIVYGLFFFMFFFCFFAKQKIKH